MQDIQLGTLMALIPFLEGGVSEQDSTYQYSVVIWILRVFQILLGFPILIFILRFLAMKTIARVYRYVPFVEVSHPDIYTCHVISMLHHVMSMHVM